MKVALAEDSALFREGVRLLLESAGHEVVVQASSAHDLVAGVCQEGNLDLVITDVRMPPHLGNDGLLAAIEIRRQRPSLPILVVSQYVADAYAMQWLRESNEAQNPAGLGYLLKERIGEIDDFLRTLQVVAAGGIVIDPTVIRTLLQPGRTEGISDLTPREQETLAYMAQGLSNVEIAAEMRVSVPGITKHIGRIFTKLGLEPETGNRRVLAVLRYLDHE